MFFYNNESSKKNRHLQEHYIGAQGWLFDWLNFDSDLHCIYFWIHL